jgi:hypothetical protein
MTQHHPSIRTVVLAAHALFLGVALSYGCHSSSSGLQAGLDAATTDGEITGGGPASSGGAVGAGGFGGSALGGNGGTSSWVVPGTGGAVAGLISCKMGESACNDGIDNDGDGRIDAADPECVGPCDNDEGTFATGISGDNMDACKQDCFFDGNSGAGDDGCEWNLKCDPANPGANAAKSCPYDANFKNCPNTQSQQCIDFCRRLTPNGCDCFGCCAVPWNGTTRTIMLAAGCTAASFGDPTKCPLCTQNPSCINTCGKCEICVGKPAPDPGCVIPPPGTPVGTGGTTGTGGTSGTGGTTGTGGTSGTGGTGGTTEPPVDQPCPTGVTYCGNGGACPGGSYCQTGCCVQWIL